MSVEKMGLEKKKPTRVLVVGSGLAGLTTAYLLSRREGFEVDVFEMGESPSLDAASVTCPLPSYDTEFPDEDGPVRRVDIPMRSFTPPYYPRLSALLSHLSLSTTPQKFTFTFPNLRFPSNFHSLPSRSPSSSSNIICCIIELISIGISYLYFTVLILLPLAQPKETETLEEWADRWWLSKSFMTEYVAPLMGAVTSADTNRVGQLPAVDVIEYRRKTLGAGHVVVKGGIGRLQQRLVKGVEASGRGRIYLGRRVVAVEDVDVEVVVVGEKGIREGVKVTWTEKMEEGMEKMDTEWYEKVVFATSPDVVTSCWKQAEVLRGIPVWPVEVVVEKEDVETVTTRGKLNEIVLSADGAAVHRVEGGISVTTQPCRRILASASSSSSISPITSSPTKQHIATRYFTRVGKSIEARRIIREYAVLKSDIHNTARTEKGYAKYADNEGEWRCGVNGVYVVGGWCWDGMVLLEGCVQSAERVAGALIFDRMVEERKEVM